MKTVTRTDKPGVEFWYLPACQVGVNRWEASKIMTTIMIIMGVKCSVRRCARRFNRSSIFIAFLLSPSLSCAFFSTGVCLHTVFSFIFRHGKAWKLPVITVSSLQNWPPAGGHSCPCYEFCGSELCALLPVAWLVETMTER